MRRIAALLSLACMAAASQALVIDSFEDGAQSLAITSDDVVSETVGGTMIGGQRLTYLASVFNPFFEKSEVLIDSNDFGVLQFSNGTRTAYDLQIYYRGGGALGLDLSALSAFRLNYLTSDLAHQVSIQLISYDGNGNVDGAALGGLMTQNLKLNPHAVEIPFSSLGDIPGNPVMDYTDVDEIVLMFTNYGPSPSTEILNPNDFVIDSFEAVPEPATLIALASGVLALAARRRK